MIVATSQPTTTLLLVVCSGTMVVHGFAWYLAVVGGVLKLLQCGTTDVGIVYLCTWDICIYLLCVHVVIASMVFTV